MRPRRDAAEYHGSEYVIRGQNTRFNEAAA